MEKLTLKEKEKTLNCLLWERNTLIERIETFEQVQISKGVMDRCKEELKMVEGIIHKLEKEWGVRLCYR